MNFFKLKENNTSVKNEFNAGLTTFLAMMYIVPVNMLIMSDAGMPKDALLTATAVITIISCIFNGFWANTPVALSVGMGLNAYFTYGLVIGMKIPWQTALGVVCISAIIFVVLSFTNFRIWIIKNIPIDLRRAISAGIGAFICFVGLKQMGLITYNPATLVGIGNISDPKVFIGALGLIIIVAFWSLNLKGGFILAVAATSVIAWIFGVYPAPSEFFSTPASLSPIFMELDIMGALKLALLPAIITFFVTHLFDSIGTLTGVCNRANLFDEHNEEGTYKLTKNLESDAITSVAGSIVGTSTITAFAESASGVEAGGRTGLTAVFTGIFFILTLFLLPLFNSIPSNAIYPILVMVGVLMFSELGKINYSDPAICVSTFLTVIFMPLTYSITVGLSIGFISYFIVKLVLRKWEDINSGIITLTIISLLAFLVISAPELFGQLLGVN
ncbi:NCS2 family permease [Campylobacter hyointestinalis]|uniref:Xanthine/uracil permease family protein n=1 Tax=Campylobacter hyointestinalis subsp. hyointestinalis TaxID=91352 RepID=A0A9W5AV36_CAMHY|nr:NCS2 family permease [Campylobacter hyointestinalis]PPB51227.1 NCS2 family permease [Campylobacter hyointestinalis subsp. hyointestinalis]CUU75486.1 xanthine/uracil permease family protein [Campylobacter hyointestinalis subsp. hyointestinalis]CUU89266.1 xanthine/uracil permease family protein [Campylobacter hyointestinalis subsp. hyointestinalis]